MAETTEDRFSPQSTEPEKSSTKHLVLAEYQRVFDYQYTAADTLEAKLKELLGSASLILTVATALQITSGIQRIGWSYLVGLALTLLLYIVFIIVILRGLRPMDYAAPVPPTWKDVRKFYFGKSEDHVLDVLIASYLKYRVANEQPVAEKARMVRYASVLFVLIVISVVLLGILGLSTGVAWPWHTSSLRAPTPTPLP